MLEGVLVDQRLRVARAQHLEIAPAEHDRLLHEVELWQRLGQAAKAARLARISPGDPRVTSVDVARAAGVSQSTVSLVLSGKSAGRISARTEAAVRRAAEELGYRPNMAARALRTGAARSVGLVVPDVTHPFFGLTMRGAQEAAWSAGYAVALVDVPLDRPLEAPLEALRAGPADGFIYFSVEPPERRPGGERIVVIEAEPEGLPWVSLDTAGGTDAALAHLIELGHRRIGQLGSRVQYPTFRIRKARWGAALESVGVEPSADAVGRVGIRLRRRGARRRANCSTPPIRRPRSSATTTSSPAACTWRPASGGCGSRRTCPSSGSTTCRSRASCRRR